MVKMKYLKVLPIIVVLIVLASVQVVSAGVFSDAMNWAKDSANIRQHSRVITGEVKTLYRERKSIQNFAEGTQTLVQAYQAIKDKNSKTSIPQLLQIARGITQVVTEYQNLAPKAERMYRNSQPSLSYFSNLADETSVIQAGKKRIVSKTFSNKRLNKLAGSAGWSRVFGTIKENPLNLFKWGKLRDEHKMGKVEAQYSLKCAQIAFEGASYFFAAREHMNQLLTIQTEIEGILGGNMASILNMGGTVNKIQSVGSTVDELANLAESAPLHMARRFAELIAIQQNYVATSQEYNRKYNPAVATRPQSRVQTPPIRSTIPARQPAPQSGQSRSGSATSLQQAMATYQKAYENYVSISQSSNATQAQVEHAVAQLQRARSQVEQLRQQQSR